MLKNSIFTWFGQLISLTLAFITYVLVARILGPSDYGKFNFLIIIPNMIQLIGGLGIPAAIVYFGSKQDFPMHNVVNTSFSISIGAGLGLVLIFIFISFSGSFQHYLLSKDLDPLLVKIMVLSVPFYIVYQNLRQILRSQEKIIEYNVLTMIFFFSTLFTTTLCLAFIQNKLFGAVCGYVLGVFITSIIAYHAVNKNIKVRFGINLDLLKKMVNFGFRNYLGTLFQYLNYRIDLLLILPLAGAYETGLYVTAVTIAERIWDIPDSIRVVIQPRITAISDEDAQELTSSVTRITIFPLILLSVGIAFSGRLLIGLLFGPEYYNSYLPLVILLPGIVAFSISKYLASHLTGRGNPQISSYAAFISLIVNILLNSYLIRYWGGVGAAIASSATYFCATLYLIIQFLSRSSLHLKDLLLMKSADFKNICNSLNSLWSYQSIRR